MTRMTRSVEFIIGQGYWLPRRLEQELLSMAAARTAKWQLQHQKPKEARDGR